jgi:hypothetical protein
MPIIPPVEPLTDEQKIELNGWIAVNVMRYIPVWGDYWQGACNEGQFNCPVEEATAWAFEYEGGVSAGTEGKTYCSRRDYEFTPTYNEEVAFEVLEKCVGKAAVLIEKVKGGYAVHNNLRASQVASGETLQEAISLFAKVIYSK